jgi:hypothetical protein
MTLKPQRSRSEPGGQVATKSRLGAFLRLIGLSLLGVFAIAGVFPAAAAAHGPIAPIASSYLARVGQVPPGLHAQVIDGDQRMWLRVDRGLTVVIVDYRGAPYLRFSPAGVDVNRNSSMYYLNHTPVALTPPSNLTATTPPNWQPVSSGDTYNWHDGRLHALASVALAPGASFVGRWRVPVLVDGRQAAIAGGLWHADNPSLVWLWPIVVVLACVIAGWRVRRPSIDRRLAKGLGIAAVIGFSAAVLVRELHGRPTITVFQLIELVIVLAFAVWALYRLLFTSPGYFVYFLIAIVALWQGVELAPTLFEGFVLAAGPAFVARAASVICVATSIGLLLMVFRIADQRDSSSEDPDELDQHKADHDPSWELA